MHLPWVSGSFLIVVIIGFVVFMYFHDWKKK